jgi:hypothetical protein
MFLNLNCCDVNKLELQIQTDYSKHFKNETQVQSVVNAVYATMQPTGHQRPFFCHGYWHMNKRNPAEADKIQYSNFTLMPTMELSDYWKTAMQA